MLLVVVVIGVDEELVRVNDGLHVQRQGVKGGKSADGPQKGGRVGKDNVHVELEDLEVAHMPCQEGHVVVVEGRAAAVFFGEAGVVAEAEGGEGGCVGEEGVDGELRGVDGDVEGGEGADVVFDEDVEGCRGFLS